MENLKENFWERLDFYLQGFPKSLSSIQRAAEKGELTVSCVREIFKVYHPEEDVKQALLKKGINIESFLDDILPKTEGGDYAYVVSRTQEELSKF